MEYEDGVELDVQAHEKFVDLMHEGKYEEGYGLFRERPNVTHYLGSDEIVCFYSDFLVNVGNLEAEEFRTSIFERIDELRKGIESVEEIAPLFLELKDRVKNRHYAMEESFS